MTTESPGKASATGTAFFTGRLTGFATGLATGFEGGLADLLLVVAEEFALTLVGSVPSHEFLDLRCRARLDTTPGSLEAH